MTEMVWEEIEDIGDTNSFDAVPKSDELTDAAAKMGDAKIKSNAAGKSKKDVKSTGGQKSMMSFFGKKT